MELIKWMLYMAVFGTSTAIGIVLSKRYQKRVEELKDFKSAFNILKTKMRFTYTPLREIFTDISKNLHGKIGIVFEKASSYIEERDAKLAWEDAINSIELNITKEDKEVILGLGKLLGKTDVEGQISEIDLCLTFLEGQIEKAESEKEKNAKLYKSLGAIAGIGIIIILL